MVVFVLFKWAKFDELTSYWKFYEEFLARTHLFTLRSLENPTHQ
jgi:hypothetical protein